MLFFFSKSSIHFVCYIVKPQWVSEDLFFPAPSDVQCLEYSLDTFKKVSWQTERVVILNFLQNTQSLQVLIKANNLQFETIQLEVFVKLSLTQLLHCHFGNSATVMVFGYKIYAFLMQKLTGNSFKHFFFFSNNPHHFYRIIGGGKMNISQSFFAGHLLNFLNLVVGKTLKFMYNTS